MIRPELYKKTVDILFEAYFNDTLEHLNCTACAVGNIVAANLGIKIMTRDDRTYPVRCFNPRSADEYANPLKYSGLWYRVIGGGDVIYEQITKDIRMQIEATGYTARELAKIENAFEEAPGGCSDDEYMFNGLVAVLEVLKDIHQVSDNTEDIKRFEAHFETIS